MLPVRFSVGILLVAIGVTLPLRLAAQGNLFHTGTPHDIAGPIDFQATGASMAGMEVRWSFPDLTEGFATWGALGGGDCGVSSGGFSVVLGCAFASNNASGWTITNGTGQAVVKVQFNGAPGNTVFDCGWDGAACVAGGFAAGTGTPGSNTGYSFAKIGGTATAVGVGTYTNVAGVGGAAPVGDLFEQFSFLLDPLPSGDSYILVLDTDNAVLAPTTAPEPATATLTLGGLAGIAAAARRRRSTAAVGGAGPRLTTA